ncbi:hypothetical protein ACRRTK_017136 [Alexandromys fortis]
MKGSSPPNEARSTFHEVVRNLSKPQQPAVHSSRDAVRIPAAAMLTHFPSKAEFTSRASLERQLAGKISSRQSCEWNLTFGPGSPLSFPPTFGGGLPISASDRSPLAGVCAPQLLGLRGPRSAQDALAEVGRRLVGGETGPQRPREVGGAEPSTGCGRPASASHVAAREARAAATAASGTPRPGAGAGTRLRRGPQQREAERQHALRRVDVCLGVVRELCSGWSSSTLRRDRGGEGRRRERWSPERARQPDAGAGGAAGGRGAAPRALVADRREGAYSCRDPAQPALGLRSSASLRRLCNAGRRAAGEPELTVVGAGDLPT